MLMSQSPNGATVEAFARRLTTGTDSKRPGTIAEDTDLTTDAAVIFPAGRRWTRRVGVLAADAGTVSIEFMLWMPIIFTIILFATDVALIYLNQANMWTAARDQARILSMTSTYTAANAQANGQAELFGPLQTACNGTCVSSTGAGAANTQKVVTIQIPLCKASLFGIVGCPGTGQNLTAKVTMASEY